MSANGLWTSRYENEEGYGDTLFSMGVINVVDNEIYIDAMPLKQYLAAYAGKVVAFEFVFGLKRFEGYEAKFDEKIAPLVHALQSLGIRTLHSCQGHMQSPDNKYDYKCPQVDFVTADLPKLKVERVPVGWMIYAAPWGDSHVSRLRPLRDAANEAELVTMQNEALTLAQNLAPTSDTVVAG